MLFLFGASRIENRPCFSSVYPQRCLCNLFVNSLFFGDIWFFFAAISTLSPERGHHVCWPSCISRMTEKNLAPFKQNWVHFSRVTHNLQPLGKSTRFLTFGEYWGCSLVAGSSSQTETECKPCQKHTWQGRVNTGHLVEPSMISSLQTSFAGQEECFPDLMCVLSVCDRATVPLLRGQPQAWACKNHCCFQNEPQVAIPRWIALVRVAVWCSQCVKARFPLFCHAPTFALSFSLLSRNNDIFLPSISDFLLDWNHAWSQALWGFWNTCSVRSNLPTDSSFLLLFLVFTQKQSRNMQSRNLPQNRCCLRSINATLLNYLTLWDDSIFHVACDVFLRWKRAIACRTHRAAWVWCCKLEQTPGREINSHLP